MKSSEQTLEEQSNSNRPSSAVITVLIVIVLFIVGGIKILNNEQEKFKALQQRMITQSEGERQQNVKVQMEMNTQYQKMGMLRYRLLTILYVTKHRRPMESKDFDKI